MQELIQRLEPIINRIVIWIQELNPLYVKAFLAIVVYIIVCMVLKSMKKSYYLRVIIGMATFTIAGYMIWKAPIEKWGIKGNLLYIFISYLLSVLINIAIVRKEPEYDEDYDYDEENDEDWEPGMFYKITHTLTLIGIASILLFFVYVRISNQTQLAFEHDVLAEYENCTAIPKDDIISANLAGKGYKNVEVHTESNPHGCNVIITAKKNMQNLEKHFDVRFVAEGNEVQ